MINYEEGGENCILHGDVASEVFLSEIIGAEPLAGARHMNIESIYEYGSALASGDCIDCLLRVNIPVTVYGVAMVEAKWEIASHGYRWIDYKYFGEDLEREHLQKAIAIHTQVTGSRPLGWYTGRTSPNTRRLVVEEGGFLYDSDSYADDLPYWVHDYGKPHLIIPYTLDNNDMRFATTQGFNCGDQFFTYLRDAFDILYVEGKTAPKMMSVGLHCRLVGRPGRIASLACFLNYVQQHERVWICRRIDIAHHWHKHHIS